MTLLVLNKDPANTDQVQLTFNGFARSQATSYTPSSANPARIVASRTSAWSSSQSFATYFVTLLVITETSQCPGAEWDVNQDTTMLPAGGKVVLHPKITSGAATATLSTPVADSGISLLVTQPNRSKGH